MDPLTMAFLAISAVNAGSAAYSAFGPQPTNEMPAQAPPTQPPNPMELPGAASPPNFLQMLEGTGIQINDELFTQAAQAAAKMGPPPTTPSQGAPTPPASTPEGGTPPPQQPSQQPAPPPQPSIGEILMASPQALASVANLLGLNQQDRTITAPIPGGTAGQVVPGFNLPQQNNIGALLAQLPRMM